MKHIAILSTIILLVCTVGMADDDMVRQDIKIFNVPLAHAAVGPVITYDATGADFETTWVDAALLFAEGYPIIRGWRYVPSTACDTERDCEDTRYDMCTFFCPECDPDDLYKSYTFDVTTGTCKWTCGNDISGVAVCIDKKDPGAGR